MYRIKAIQPNGSELTIYDPVGAGALPVIGPRISEEINEAGTLEFSLVYGHPAYGLLEPKKTYISVELQDKEIYFGRVVNAEPSPMTGQTQYSCAGALSFLQDSEVPPDGKKADGSSDYKTMTAEAFFYRCLTAHNNDVGPDPRRLFSVGIVNHSRKDEQREYRISSYQDTKSVIEQNLLNYYGGFLRVRRHENGGLLLDWLEDDYGDTDAGVLDLGENIISLVHRMTGENLFTAIRPVGQDGLVLSGGETVDLFPSADMGQYGKIVRSISFPSAANESELRSKAQEYVNKLQKTLSISSDVKLLDMKFVDGNSHGVNLGDKFTNIVDLEGVPLLVSARNRDFENPQNDSCTLKNKKAYEGTDSTEKESGSSTLSKRSSRNSAAAGYAYKHIHEYGEKLELNAKEISIIGEQVEIHADQLVETANEFVRISRKEGEQDVRLGIIEGTGVFQNSEHITQIAGKFHYDTLTGAVELIDGTEFKIHDRDGAMITVGTRLNELGNKTAMFEGSALWTQRNNITGVVGEFDIVTNPDGTRTLVIKSGGGIKIRRDNTEFGLYDEGSLTGGIMVDKLNDGTVLTRIRGDIVNLEANGGYTQLVADKNGLQQTVQSHSTTITNYGYTIQEITGSALWTQRNNITGVVGEFDVVTSPDGSKILVVKSGGGIKIRRNNTEFGLYDEGSLTAGVIVNKINDGTTKIAGNKVVISGDTTISDIFLVDGNGIHALRELYGTGATFSGAVNTGGVNFTGYGNTTYRMTAATVSTMIKTAAVSGNTLTLTRFDDTTVTFSKATSLSGEWSGNKLTVTALPQNVIYETYVGADIGQLQGETGYFMYPNYWTPTATTPVAITDAKKQLIIADSSDDVVKLKKDSTDTGLVYYHGKYTAGVSAGRKSVTPSISWPVGWTVTASNPYDNTKTASIEISMSHGSDSAGHYIELHSNETSSPLKAKKTISLNTGSVSSGSRTVKVNFAGSDILSATISDYSNGQSAAGISTSWGTGSGANVLTVERALSSSTKSATFTVTAGAPTGSYNSSTHKYVLTGAALVNGTQRATGSGGTGTEAYDAGVKQGRADSYKVTLDSGNNHANDWWNCIIYNSSGTVMKSITTDQSSMGLFIPFADVEITANGRYLPSSYTTYAGHTAVVFSGITVNVPGGGSTPVASNIDLNSPEWMWDSAWTSLPSSDARRNAVELTTIKNLIRDNHGQGRAGWLLFRATYNGGTGAKWYRINTQWA